MLMSLAGWAQGSQVTLSGGYAFANVEDTELSASGFRVNALYEYVYPGAKWAQGLSVGYIGTTAEDDVQGEYDITSWPVYYAPKYLFGSDKFKGFVKGALGVQFSHLKRTGPAIGLEDNDTGLFTGLGAGLMVYLSDNILLNLEYEWAYMSNSFYRDGFMNSAMLGIGYRFY